MIRKKKSKILMINKLYIKQPYCLKCRKNIESKNTKIANTKNGRIMVLSNCEVCSSKKSKFVKEHEASRLLSSLGIKIS